MDQALPSTSTATIPLEVHVFEHSGYGFDARNYSILELERGPAAVLRLMSALPLDTIVTKLRSELSATEVRAS